jgi:IS605 OrfB family transposase
MKLVAQVKLLASPEQAALLEETLHQANAACNFLAAIAWEERAFGRYALQKLAYSLTRAAFPTLAAQVVIRCIARVADAYRANRQHSCQFSPRGAIAYDARILRWYPSQATVSLWACGGRLRLPFVCGERQQALLQTQQGESDLVYRDGVFYLYATCDVEEPPAGEFAGVLGLDLGIVSLAVDSDGEVYSGAGVEQNRRRHAHRRRNLQKKGTKAAKRKLRRLAGKQARFQRDTNHRIAKRVVRKAQGTSRAIAVEDLTGMRARTTVSRRQRARHANWSFYQLRQFIEYKAQQVGVRVIPVDPRHTSQTCPVCGHVARANRRAQALFSCLACGYSAPADYNAAQNIRARATVNRPMVSTPHQG